jgi:hypothetical protein
VGAQAFINRGYAATGACPDCIHVCHLKLLKNGLRNGLRGFRRNIGSERDIFKVFRSDP